VSKERERSQEAEDLDILDINIGENDLIKESRGMGMNEKYISRDKNVQENPESENKVTTTTEDPPDEKVDPVKELEQRKAVEAKLQAAMLAQRNARFAQPIVQPKPKLQKNQEDNGSQFVTSTTPTVHYPNLPLPRYSYSYSRTFITAEQKVEHFPNLYKRFFIPIDSDGDDSSDEDCPKDCGSKKKGVVTDQSLVKFLRNLRSDSPR